MHFNAPYYRDIITISNINIVITPSYVFNYRYSSICVYLGFRRSRADRDPLQQL